MRKLAVLSMALLGLFAHLALARTVSTESRSQPQIQSTSSLSFARPAAKSAVDTTYLLGGPGSWDGSFETPGGEPDWQGWTHEDVSLDPDNHWHVSDYMADQIPGHGPGNHAMYCGDETIASCGLPDTVGGYGNEWLDEIEWRQTVANPSVPVTIRLTGAMKYDTEPSYDFVYLFVQRGADLEILESWDGQGTALVDIETTVSPGEFIGPGNDEVRLFWRFNSDGSFDDYDCRWPTVGACQIDDLTVYINGLVATSDDFEPGNPVNWIQTELPGVGDFTSLRNNLNSVHSCQAVNTSYQVNFVDDGLVVPGTEGTPCIDWCYGPDGWILNHDGGLMADTGFDAHLINQAVSPAMAWPGDMEGAHLAFDIFIHEPFTGSSSGMFGYWKVRSTASSDPADLENAPWVNRNVVIENSSGSYRRWEEFVGDLLVPDRQWVQMAVGVNEFGFHFGINGPNGTPSPYFDNVSFKVWDPVGPEISVRNNNLFADAFPEAGTLDPVDLAANWGRVDMAGNNSRFERGDTLVAEVTSLRHDATVVNPPSLHWAMKCNPIFDAVRQSAPGPDGVARGMVPGSVAVAFDQPHPGKWAFDLPDTGFFYPGDMLQYYITASDDLAGDIRTGAWPADTTGVLDFSATSLYPYQGRINGLPTVTQPAAGTFEHPAILLIDDSASNPDSRSIWLESLVDLGIVPGDDLEILTIFTPDDLGYYVNAGLLGGYHTMIYSAGSTSPSLDESGPTAILGWLDTGGKKGLFMGENLVSRLSHTNGNSGAVLMARLGVYFENGAITRENGGYWDLVVSPIPGNGVLPEGAEWQVNAACPKIRWVDALSTTGDGQSAATLDPEGFPGGPFSAVVTVDDQPGTNRTILLPFDLDAVSGMTVGSAKSGRSYLPASTLAYYLMTWLGADVAGTGDDLPGAGRVSVNAHPNPFNPQTTIAFELPRAMEVSLDIYDLQGRLVRRLLDESPFISGNHQQVWDGRDREGRATSSGVYFFRFVAGDQKRVGKLTLLK